MSVMPIVNLREHAQRLAASRKRVSALWQHDDSLAFITGRREYRSEFYINPKDETMFMMKGERRLFSRALPMLNASPPA